MKSILEDSQTWLIVIALLVSLMTLFTVLLFYIRNKSAKSAFDRYDSDKKIIELEYIRKNMESQLFHVSKKLEENENRWKDVNHLVISSQNANENANSTFSGVKPNNFLLNFGIVDLKEYEVDPRLVFVLTPFGDEFKDTFYTIRNTCERLKLKCVRGDETFASQEIFPSILRQIVRARFVIANITGRNPNVMYELGICHAFGKPTIIVSQNFTDIPFDLNNKRIIIFKNDDGLQSLLEDSILDTFLQPTT